jgi:hypothetical protein
VQTCGICNTQSSDDVVVCPRCGADLRQSSNNGLALRRMQQNSRVSQVRISIMDNCCPACAAAMGTYPKEDVPPLPTEGCSHPLGCRCHYEPVLAEIFP